MLLITTIVPFVIVVVAFLVITYPPTEPAGSADRYAPPSEVAVSGTVVVRHALGSDEFAVSVDTDVSLVDLANRCFPYKPPSLEGWRGVGDSLIRYSLGLGRVIGDSTETNVIVRLCSQEQMLSLLATHRPATMRELLCFGSQHKLKVAELSERDLVALGTKKVIATTDDAPLFPCLFSYKGESTFLFTYSRKWPEQTVFAMVHK